MLHPKAKEMARRGVISTNPFSYHENNRGPDGHSPNKALPQEFCMRTELNISKVGYKQENHFKPHLLSVCKNRNNKSEPQRSYPTSRCGWFSATEEKKKNHSITYYKMMKHRPM